MITKTLPHFKMETTPFQNENSPILNPIIKMEITNTSGLSEVTKKCEPSEPTPYFNLAMTKKRS